MKKYIIGILAALCVIPANASSVYRYRILKIVNDETIIFGGLYGNAVTVKAKTYCYGFYDGDSIISTKDLSSCTSATLIKESSGRICEVWCE